MGYRGYRAQLLADQPRKRALRRALVQVDRERHAPPVWVAIMHAIAENEGMTFAERLCVLAKLGATCGGLRKLVRGVDVRGQPVSLALPVRWCASVDCTGQVVARNAILSTPFGDLRLQAFRRPCAQAIAATLLADERARRCWPEYDELRAVRLGVFMLPRARWLRELMLRARGEGGKRARPQRLPSLQLFVPCLEHAQLDGMECHGLKPLAADVEVFVTEELNGTHDWPTLTAQLKWLTDRIGIVSTVHLAVGCAACADWLEAARGVDVLSRREDASTGATRYAVRIRNARQK